MAARGSSDIMLTKVFTMFLLNQRDVSGRRRTAVTKLVLSLVAGLIVAVCLLASAAGAEEVSGGKVKVTATVDPYLSVALSSQVGATGIKNLTATVRGNCGWVLLAPFKTDSPRSSTTIITSGGGTELAGQKITLPSKHQSGQLMSYCAVSSY